MPILIRFVGWYPLPIYIYIIYNIYITQRYHWISILLDGTYNNKQNIDKKQTPKLMKEVPMHIQFVAWYLYIFKERERETERQRETNRQTEGERRLYFVVWYLFVFKKAISTSAYPFCYMVPILII